VWSHDRTQIASAGPEGTVAIWDASGQPLRDPLTGLDGAVAELAWSADDSRLASSSPTGHLVMWMAERPGDAVSLVDPIGSDAFGEVSFSWHPLDDRLAAVTLDGELRIWVATTQELVAERDLGAPVSEVAWSPDGELLALSLYDGTIRIASADGDLLGQPITADRVGAPVTAWSPDGAVLATGSARGEVRLWDPATGTPLGAPLVGHRAEILSLAWSPDGTRLASASADQTVRLWSSVTEAQACGLLAGGDLADQVEARFGTPFICTERDPIPELPPLPVVPWSPQTMSG
jgi:WD40 repeat protein